MKTQIYNNNEIFSKTLLCALFAFILFITSSNLIAQKLVNQNKLGAKLLTKDQYSKLPKVNWDTLIKYSNVQHILVKKSASTSASITMLNTPPVGQQGNQNSCVGWAAGYAALGILSYPKYNCWNLAARSPGFIYNQIKLFASCDSGAHMSTALNLIKSVGDCSLNAMPYIESDCTALPNSKQLYDASFNKTINWYSMTNNNDVAGIKNALDLGYPLPIVFKVYDSFDFMWGFGGLWNSNWGNKRGVHAACIVGYDDVKQMFKVQNSWGLDGDPNNPGFFWVAYSMVQNSCIDEVYVIYGVTLPYPETISKSSADCSSDFTFTVNNMPLGSSVSWNKSANLNLSSASDSSAVFTFNSAGQSWVQATVNSSSCSSIVLPQYNFWAGIPNYTFYITRPDGYPVTTNEFGDLSFCPNTNYNIYIWANGIRCYSNTHTWSVPSTWTVNYESGSTISINTNDDPANVICVDAKSCCMEDFSICQSFEYSDYCQYYSSYSLTFTPNPSTTETTLTIVTKTNKKLDETTQWDFEIYDSMQRLKAKIQKIKGDKRTINTSGWRDGIYIVRAWIKGEIVTGKLIVKK